MARDDDDFGASRKSSKAQHLIGEPLDTISIEELVERVTILHAEIHRLEAAIVKKRASREAAASVFKGK
jgi:uncharacterized small protein (DUF1192 family)